MSNNVYIPPINQVYMPDAYTYAAPIDANLVSPTPEAFRGGLSSWDQFIGKTSQIFGGTDANGTPSVPDYNPTGNNPSGMLGNMSPFQAGVSGLGALSSAFGAFNGYKQTKLAKQQLAFQKDAFNKQWNAQRNLTNSHLEDRQKQRVARDPNAMSVTDYMNKYGI